MSLLAAVLWMVATVLYHIVDRIVGQSDASWMAWRPERRDPSVACVAVWLRPLLLLAAAVPAIHEFILNLGLGYMVFMSLAVGLHLALGSGRPQAGRGCRLSTWVGAMVLIFAAVAATLADEDADCRPVFCVDGPNGHDGRQGAGRVGLRALGNVIVMHYQDYWLVGVSVVVSHVVTRLGQEVAKAREMGSYQSAI